MTKQCSTCKEVKGVGEFSKDKRNKDRLQARCKRCDSERSRKWAADNPERSRERSRKWAADNPERKREGSRKWTLKAKYDLTPEDYDKLHDEQGGVCAICSKAETALDNTRKPRSLAVDHCHDTSYVRGLLCGRCNTGIGLLNDDPVLLNKSAGYIIRHARINGARYIEAEIKLDEYGKCCTI